MAEEREPFDWERARSGYTAEGQIEDWGDLARGARRFRSPWVKAVAVLLVVAMVLSLAWALLWALLQGS
jgi:hypothetical protein